MPPAPCSRSPFTAAVAALVCAALAVTPAAAQVKADGTPVETSPAPAVKTDHTARDAAVAAGVVAVGTALWLRHRAEAKKQEEAAAAAAAAAATPPQPVETPAPAPVTTAAAVEPVPPPPAPEVAAPAPAPVVKKDEPVQLSHHGSSTSSSQKAAPKPVPVAAPVLAAVPVAPPVVQAAPAVAPAPPPAPTPERDNRLWIALGVLGALLLGAGALPRMLMTPPAFRARVRMKAPSVSAPSFRAAKEQAA